MYPTLKKCKTCDILYAISIPDENSIEEEYKNADFDSSSVAKMASQTYGNYLKKYMNQNPGSIRTKYAMDIGTGEGSFLKELKDIGFEKVVGVEPSIAPIKCADSNIRPLIMNTAFRSDDFAKESFDLITFFQTIEHVFDPVKTINGFHELLNSQGVVFIIAHDFNAVSAKILKTKSPIFDIEHLQLFSKKGLYKFLMKSGFEDIFVFGIKNRYPLAYIARLFPFPQKIKKPLVHFLENSQFGNLKINLYMGNIAAFARKK